MYKPLQELELKKIEYFIRKNKYSNCMYFYDSKITLINKINLCHFIQVDKELINVIKNLENQIKDKCLLINCVFESIINNDIIKVYDFIDNKYNNMCTIIFSYVYTELTYIGDCKYTYNLRLNIINIIPHSITYQGLDKIEFDM